MTDKDYATIQRLLGLIEGVAVMLPHDPQVYICGVIDSIDAILDKERKDESIQ